MLQCENCYCVYWKNHRCLLKEIALDIHGACQACRIVYIEESQLAAWREAERQEYNERYFLWAETEST